MTPPCELVQQWWEETQTEKPERWVGHLADQAAQWGYEQRGATNEAALQKARDEELEACLEEIRDGAGRGYIDEPKLRVCLADDIWTARRPHSTSLKEQALEALKHVEEGWRPVPADCEIIRRALEQLNGK